MPQPQRPSARQAMLGMASSSVWWQVQQLQSYEGPELLEPTEPAVVWLGEWK